MTTTELKKTIAGAKNIEWFKNVKGTFNMPYINISIQLKGFSSIYEHVNQQLSGWKALEHPLPIQLQSSESYFQNIRDQIINFVNTHLNQDENVLNSFWNNINNAISNINNKPLNYNSPEVEFLIKINTNMPIAFSGAHNFIVETDCNVNTRVNFIGALLAYEFKYKDVSELSKRIKSEQKTLSNLKNEFQKYLSESETLLITHLNEANLTFENYVKKIDELKIEKDENFTKWFENIKNEDWENWYNPCKNRILELENIYKEKLKLEEPAKYWAERGSKLKKQGWIALAIMVGLVLLSCWSLQQILWHTPNQIYASWFSGDKSAAIRWAIVYISLLSFIVFAIRAVNKVMFSSFHLARDCEERYTLTYFYLSLLKDSKVDEKDRQLIMQSLFSRAETGLLREDSSPTMPSETLTKLISK